MTGHLHVALAAAVTLALTTLGLPWASATPAEGPAHSWRAADGGQTVTTSRWAGLRPRPSPTPTATATPTATPTAAPTATTTPTACAFPTVSFNGAVYCPATIVGVRGTLYGTGTRVVLRGVTVTAVTSTVTVATWETPPCPPGNFCGATLTLQSLTVSWTGTSRPAYGDVLDLFGLTVRNSITPDGYIKTGFCPIDLC